MPSVRWNLDEVADFLDVTVGEARDLIEAGYLHYEELNDEKSFDESAVKEWRRAMADGGARGGAYLRELLADGAVQHA
jgi:hypothetical protein